MPVYEYECAACKHHFEEWQKINDKPVRTCPKCKERKVERLISQTSFQLKGGGWYSDLYSSKKAAAPGSAEGSAAGDGGKGSGDGAKGSGDGGKGGGGDGGDKGGGGGGAAGSGKEGGAGEAARAKDAGKGSPAPAPAPAPAKDSGSKKKRDGGNKAAAAS